MAISHTLAFCPRRVAHLCPPGALRHWGQPKAEGFRRGLEKMQAPCHWAPYGTSSRLSPWTWPHPALHSLTHSHTHTHPHTHTHTHTSSLLLSRFTVKSRGCQEVWTVHFLIQTNAAPGSRNYHGVTRCFRWLASVECLADREGERLHSVLLGSIAAESLWPCSVEINKQIKR